MKCLAIIRRVWDILFSTMFSTPPRFGLTVVLLGVVQILLVFVQDRPQEDNAIGYLIMFIGLTWAALTAYLASFGRSFSGVAYGWWFVLACVASVALEARYASLSTSCVVYACVYLIGLLADVAYTAHEDAQRVEHMKTRMPPDRLL